MSILNTSDLSALLSDILVPALLIGATATLRELARYLRGGRRNILLNELAELAKMVASLAASERRSESQGNPVDTAHLPQATTAAELQTAVESMQGALGKHGRAHVAAVLKLTQEQVNDLLRLTIEHAVEVRQQQRIPESSATRSSSEQ